MIGSVLSTLIEVTKWCILVRLFASLFWHAQKPDWLLTLERWTEPLLEPFRRILKPIEFGNGYIDISPVILFFVLSLLQGAVSWLF